MIVTAYENAREEYAALGVDTEAALAKLSSISLSLPCWQLDDVSGFEKPGAALSSGGIQATGGRHGKARDAAELRADLEFALSLIPGRHRVNLHAMYGEFAGRCVDRDAIEPGHFAGWIAWAGDRGVGLDFNATLFSHPAAVSGFTLSHPDPEIRKFWIAHVSLCRSIATAIGVALDTACVHNTWIPDGMKDSPADRAGFRERLLASLDAALSEKHQSKHMLDAVEAKLFGIGSESFVAGSHEFYLGYALSRGVMPCLDSGHFHPTESVADKISSILLFAPRLLLHLSRGLRWDSDHVPVFDDQLREMALEIVRQGDPDRVRIALDFFDASVNRVGALVLGARAVQKALLFALLEPYEQLKRRELAGDYLGRLSLMEDHRAAPIGVVFDEYCARHSTPPAGRWLALADEYERKAAASR